MTHARWLARSERWFRLLLRLYPADFRDEMGTSLVETYRDRCRAALAHGGAWRLPPIWLGAVVDSLRNGLAERLRPAVSWRRGGNWGRDFEMVLRRMRRAPLFVTAMAGTLTVGLGAFAMVYTVVSKVLIAPLPYERPQDLYFVWRDITWINFPRGWVAGTDVVELQKQGGPIAEAVGLRTRSATISGAANVEPTEITLMVTSARLFGMLGVRPALGRLFMPDEEGDGRRNLIVLGHSLWSRLGADSSVVGRDIRLDGQAYTVIGVMGRSFDFMRHQSLGPPEGANAYTTFAMSLASTSPGSGSFAALIRARPGTTFPVVSEAVTAVGRVVDERDFQKRGMKLYPVSLSDDLVVSVRPALVALGVAGVFLLLVLLVNLATLLLARAAQREQEFAVCRALGANSGALARATMLEGALLGALGGGGGALLAMWGVPLLASLAPLDLPRRASIVMDGWIVLIVIVVGTLLGLVAGTVPATWAVRTRLDALLRGVAVRGGGGHGRMRRAMVAVQVALSLVLLSSGALVVRSFERLLRATPGFEAAGVLTLRVPVPAARYPNDTVRNALHARLEQALASLPGVTSVGAASALPLSAGSDQSGVIFPGAPGNTGDRERDNPLVDYFTTRAGYIESMGIKVLGGRAFAQSFIPGTREALVDRTLAAQFWPGGSPIGARMLLDSDTFSIIGVVEHARLYDVHKDGRGQVYLRNEAVTYGTMSWILRTDRLPRSLIPEVRTAVRQIDPELAIADLYPMEELVSASLSQQRLTAVLIGGFSIGALLLAAMGLFGVVSGSVTRRRHEIAVRLALGADYGRVLRVVIGEGARLIALGLLIGAPGIYFAGQVIRGTLVGISPFDPTTLASVAVGLGLVAVTACYLPARRVARIEPARALREE